MLYLIGLGLGDAKDITVKGLEIVKSAKQVFLESYTSVLSVGKETLEKFYGRELILADRELVEQNSDVILQDAATEDVAFLVVGDPLGATTHSDLILRAVQLGISYRVIHNASIITAVGCCGLQLYNFGETVSIVMWSDDWQPDSYVDRIDRNLLHGNHTLCLLDIKMKEQSIENLMKGNKVFEPPRFMSASNAANQLLEIIKRRENDGQPLQGLTADTKCVGLARIGSDSEHIVMATLAEMSHTDLGPPLHSLVIVGNTHPLEDETLKLFSKPQ